jgi:glucose/arabinose dehydrogenase
MYALKLKQIFSPRKFSADGFAAVPPDVRKVCDFPTAVSFSFGATPQTLGRSPENNGHCSGKAKPYRTSGGTAAGVFPNFFTAKIFFVFLSLVTFAGTLTAQPLKPHRIMLTNGKSYTLNLPAGYDITVAAQGMSRVRFLAKSPDDRVFVTDLYNRADNNRGAIYILEGFDGKQFQRPKVWLNKLRNPNSIAFHTDRDGTHWLYIALTDKLVRHRYTLKEDKPTSAPETLAKFPDYGLNYKYGGWHLTRTIAIASNKLYVSVGSSCNACEETEEMRAAILEMDLDGKNSRVFASGLRNAVGLRWIAGKLLTTNMGPDHLGDDKPSDTMYEVKDGTNYGWPYCYQLGKRNVADPQFTSSKKRVSCDTLPAPFASFIAHSSPLGFESFGDYYLVALHGSGFIRIGHGYGVAMVRPGQPPQDFITGFLLNRKINGRPVDILKFGKGFLLTDDYAGVVYYIFKS